jgi:hypothetical protein
VTLRRPALRYYGGKWKLANWLIANFPPHRIYVEPFGGGASVLLQKPRSYAEVYNDLDGEIVNVFEVLRCPTTAAKLERALRLTPFSRTEFIRAYRRSRRPIEQARRTIIKSFMGFGSSGIYGNSNRGMRTRASTSTGFRSNSSRSGTTPAHDVERYTGVRRDESESRKDRSFREWDPFFDCYINNPIADWSKKMCFEYVTAHGEKFNELYKLGFDRVGCSPCINATKEDITAWAQRFPEMIDKVRRWEQRVGKTFFSPRFNRGSGVPNFVDDVVEWARTSHGGRQFIILPPRPNCESKYGVCE